MKRYSNLNKKKHYSRASFVLIFRVLSIFCACSYALYLSVEVRSFLQITSMGLCVLCSEEFIFVWNLADTFVWFVLSSISCAHSAWLVSNGISRSEQTHFLYAHDFGVLFTSRFSLVSRGVFDATRWFQVKTVVVVVVAVARLVSIQLHTKITALSIVCTDHQSNHQTRPKWNEKPTMGYIQALSRRK